MSTDDTIESHATSIEIDSVSDMDEIELDLGGVLDDEAFAEDAKGEFDDDDEDEDEDKEDGEE